MGIGDSIKRFFKKLAKWVAAIGMILCIIAIPLFFVMEAVIVPVILLCVGTGLVVTAFLIDKEEAKKGIQLVKDAVKDVAEGIGSTAGAVAGGLLGGATSGFLNSPFGLLLLGVGIYILWRWLDDKTSDDFREEYKPKEYRDEREGRDIPLEEVDWNVEGQRYQRGDVLSDWELNGEDQFDVDRRHNLERLSNDILPAEAWV